MLLAFLLSSLLKGYSQKIKQISISATTEAIGLPFTNYLPYHPGFEAKVNLKKTEKPNSIRYVNANVGFFYHQKLETAIYLGGEYQFTRKFNKGKFGLDVPVGLGYLHSFYPGDLYEQTPEGDFEKISQSGRPHLYVNLGVGVSYLGNARVQPYLRQELMLETPFANGIPAIPHSLLKIGVHINLK